MKSVIKRSLFVAISLALAGLTARRMRHGSELEGRTENGDKGDEGPLGSQPLPDARAGFAAGGQETARMAESPAGAEPRVEVVAADVGAETAAPPMVAPTVIFSGTVVRNGPLFALRETAGAIYPLDSARRARRFEGEDVRVTGKLDLDTRLLYVDAIESAGL